MFHLRTDQIQSMGKQYLCSIHVLCMGGMPTYHTPVVSTGMQDLVLYVLQTVYKRFHLMEVLIQSFLLKIHIPNYLYLHQKQTLTYDL